MKTDLKKSRKTTEIFFDEASLIITVSTCNGCGHCEYVCPTEAVTVTDKEVLTDVDMRKPKSNI